MEKEIRYFESPVEIEEREDGESRTIKGVAAVFNKLSQELGWFREKIDPAAFEKCDMADVIACRNHDPDKVMARTTAETLDLKTEKKGLNYSFDAPNTTAGNDTLEDVRIGNITHSSFAFTVQKDMWEEGKKGESDIRTILEFKKLYDVSPVTNPAYLQTSVGTSELARRSHDEWKKEIKLEDSLDGVDNVLYKGEEFSVGNRKHNEVELYKDGKFIQTVDIKDVEKKEIPPDTLLVREAELKLIELA